MENFETGFDFWRKSSWQKGEAKKEYEKMPLEKPFDNEIKIIKLPEPDLLPDKNVNFLELIETRQTIRQYNRGPLTLGELSYLLWCTQGVKMANNIATKRTVPSAGSCHPLETYLIINKVENLDSGIYRFLPLEHALIPVKANKKAVINDFGTDKVVENSAVTFIWSAVIRRSARYGARAWRYIGFDAGHVCQNLYLAAQTIDCGVCALGHFDDVKINKDFSFDENEEFAVYAGAVGKI